MFLLGCGEKVSVEAEALLQDGSWLRASEEPDSGQRPYFKKKYPVDLVTNTAGRQADNQ